jgi:hypothetical protein
MTTLTNNTTTTTLCSKGHTPHKESMSSIMGFGVDTQYTFCEVCEQNIERDYYEAEDDRSARFSNWYLSA